MATQLQMRRGTASQNSSFTGAVGEVSVNTTNDSLHIHDGSTAGGFELARVDGSNWAITNAISTTANISFGDNDKAIFGAGSDLQIYHDGNDSYIQDSGTGLLFIRGSSSVRIQGANGESAIDVNENGSVNLYYDNSNKLSTTSTGIDVTGSVTADGLTVDGDASVITLNNTDTSLTLGQTLAEIKFDQNDPSDQGAGTVASIEIENKGSIQGLGQFNFKTGSATSLLDRLSIGEGGDISFYEDTGTTPKFFWDASAESLGVGTSSPDEQMHLHGGSSATRLRISGGALNETYGGFIEGEGVSGQGGHLRLGVVDNGTDRVAIEIEEQGNQIVFDTAGTERMRIDSSGNVGINVSSSLDQKLNMADTADVGIKMTKTGSITTTMRAVGGALAFGVDGGAGTTERMRIDSSGNLLVGTTSGADRLNVYQSAGGTICTLESAGTAGAYALQFKNPNGTVGNVTISGSSTSYNTSSDQRLKENIEDAPSASDDIDAIQVRSFDWKADGSHQKYGMVAQELQAVAPEAVSAPEDPDEMMGVDYSKLVPMLVKEIQSLRARVAQLEN